MNKVYLKFKQRWIGGILLSMLFLVGISAQTSDPDSTIYPDTNNYSCEHPGTIIHAGMEDCGISIQLDDGILITPVLDSLYPFEEGMRVIVGYEFYADAIDHCSDGELVILTCIEIINDSSYCDAEFLGIPSDIEITGYPYEFTDVSHGIVLERTWIIDGDSVSSEPTFTHAFQEQGMHTICLNILTEEGCFDMECQEWFIGDEEPCKAEFEYYPLDYVVDSSNSSFFDSLGFAYQFIQSSYPMPIEYIWSVNGDMMAMTSEFIYVFPEPGVYEVCLSIVTEDGCSSTHCEEVYVQTVPDCKAYFEYYSPLDDVDSLSIMEDYPGSRVFQFIDNSVGNISLWYWDFGDGMNSQEQNPIHEFENEGIYEVCLVVSNDAGCEDIYCQTVYIDSMGYCEAMFEYCKYSTPHSDSTIGDSIVGENSYIIGFKNTSSPDYAWSSWDFGDGSSSNDINPIHIYNYPGTYMVCLSIYSYDCFATYCAEVVVGEGNCPLDFTSDIIVPDCWGFEIAHRFFPVLSDAVTSYYWDFDDGSVSYDAQPAHIFADEGEFNVCLQVVYSNGCLGTACHTVYNSDIIIDSVFYDKCSKAPSAIDTKSSINGMSNVIAYPVPASESISIKFASTEQEELSIHVYNAFGQLIASQDEYISSGENIFTVQLEDFLPGTYFYKLKTSNGTYQEKFSVIRF